MFPVGTNTVTWTATDSHGNTATCSQLVIVTGNQPPSITCPALVTVVASPGLCGATNVALGTPTVSDNCGAVASITNNAPAMFPVGTNTVTWTATDSHGNTVTCSQLVIVTVNQPPSITCPPLVTVVASPGLCGATNVTLGTPTVSGVCGVATITNNAPVIFPVGTNTVTWTATDSHGNTVTCPQLVIVIDNFAQSVVCSGTNKTVQAGSAWTFNPPTVTSSGGTNYTITVLSTTTNFGCAGSYVTTRTWLVADACGASARCSQTVTVVDTTAPVVSIVSPTNGEAFAAPATFTVLANALDNGGTVATVEFFLNSTNRLGEGANSGPGDWFVVVTNLPPGSNYVLTARATDGCGNISTSAPVRIAVLSALPLCISNAPAYNPQTDLFQQSVRVCNITDRSDEAVRLSVFGITNAFVYNPSGVSGGVQYVQSSGPVAPGTHVDFVIEYYVTNRNAQYLAGLKLVASLVPPSSQASAIGTGRHIDRGVMLPDKTFLIEFTSVSNRIYYIQYRASLTDTNGWKTAQPAITGNGSKVQWIDNGQPKTESPPASASMKLYQLIELP